MSSAEDGTQGRQYVVDVKNERRISQVKFIPAIYHYNHCSNTPTGIGSRYRKTDIEHENLINIKLFYGIYGNELNAFLNDVDEQNVS